MGATDDIRRFNGKESELPQMFRDLQDRLRYEHGHGGYTGTMAEAQGLTICTEKFSDEKAANDWLQKKIEKFGPALAVRYGNPDENKWLVGAMCSI